MDQSDWSKFNAAYGKVVAKAWSDPTFRAKLLAEPRVALAAEGAAVPADVTIKVFENTDKVIHLVLPPKPSSALSDEALAAVAGGATKNKCKGIV